MDIYSQSLVKSLKFRDVEKNAVNNIHATENKQLLLVFCVFEIALIDISTLAIVHSQPSDKKINHCIKTY